MGKSKDLATGAAYQDQTESDTRYVNTAGDTMTGNLAINNASGSQVTLHRTDTTIANDDLYGQIILSGDDADTNASGTRGYIRARSQGSGGGLKMEFGTAGGGVVIGDPRMTINADGIVTMPNQPNFRVKGNTGGWQTVSSASEQTVLFGDEQWDLGSNFDTSNGRFTAPVAGKYFFHFHAYVRQSSQNDGSDYGTSRLYKNGSLYSGSTNIFGYQNLGDGDQIAPLTTIMDMSASDYATCVVRANSGSTQFYQPNCIFMGYLIG